MYVLRYYLLLFLGQSSVVCSLCCVMCYVTIYCCSWAKALLYAVYVVLCVTLLSIVVPGPKLCCMQFMMFYVLHYYMLSSWANKALLYIVYDVLCDMLLFIVVPGPTQLCCIHVMLCCVLCYYLFYSWANKALLYTCYAVLCVMLLCIFFLGQQSSVIYTLCRCMCYVTICFLPGPTKLCSVQFMMFRCDVTIYFFLGQRSSVLHSLCCLCDTLLYNWLSITYLLLQFMLFYNKYSSLASKAVGWRSPGWMSGM